MNALVATTLTCVVKGPNGVKFAFEAQPRNRAENPDADLEAEFYTKNGAPVPEGTHFELELLKGPPGMLQAKHVHRHQNPETKTWFVCYTAPIPTHKEADDFFKVWCVGTVYTLIHGEDFAPIVYEVTAGAKDNQPFLDLMRQRYQIELVWL